MIRKNFRMGIIIIFLAFSCKKGEEEIRYYKNKQVKLKVPLENGKREGVMYLYDSNGVLKNKSNWKNGLMDGLSIHYHPNGQVKEKSYWKENKTEGIVEQFYNNGKIKSRTDYKNNKIKNNTLYYSSGELMEFQVYQDEQLAYFKKFREDGRILMEAIVPFFVEKNDTVLIGEQYNVKINFGINPKGRIKILTGKFNNEDNLIDTTAILEGTTMNFIIRKKLKKQEKILFPFISVIRKINQIH